MKYAPYRREEPLSRLKKECFPHELLFIDTETKPFYITKEMWFNVFYLGVAIYVSLDKNANTIKRNIYHFNSVSELLLIFAELLRKKKRIMIIGHNIAFDIEVLNLAKIFHELGVETSYPIRNGMTFIWSVKTGTGSMTFIDTANYATTNLEKIGKELGNEKIHINFLTCTDDELRAYCENDVYITELFIMEYIRFLLNTKMGEFKTTIASQSLTAYRHSFMDRQPIFHNNDKVNEIEKYSYFGGRTEAFYIGKVPQDIIYNLDVCSEYPAAMIASKLPYEMVRYNDKIISSVFEHHLKHNYMIVDCIIDTEKPVFPVRAIIRKTKTELIIEIKNEYSEQQNNHKIIYPVGKFRTWLHLAEFKYALENNMIKNVYAYVVYKSTDLFSDYVNTLFDYKVKYSRENKPGFRYIVKILLNSLYGKWGQEYHVTKFIGNVPDDFPMITYGYSQSGGFNFTDINWFGKLYRSYQTGLSTYAFPAIAGAITSNARMILWNYIEKAGKENVYYTDTDSLFVNHSGFINLADCISDGKIGKLELKSSSNSVYIFGNKDYIFDKEITHKGVAKNAEYTSEGKWKFLHFEGFNNWRNNGANLPPVSEYIEKTRTNIYDKGIVQNDGTIQPYCLVSSLNVLVFPLAQFEKCYLHSVYSEVQ